MITKATERIIKVIKERRKPMPVHAVYQDGKLIGWKWEKTGKLYKRKEDAEKQERAILASGWKEKRK